MDGKKDVIDVCYVERGKAKSTVKKGVTLVVEVQDVQSIEYLE